MRKAYIILTGIFFTLLFTACRQFTADIDDYLSYWSAEAYIADSTIKAVVQNDLNNIPSVPSAQDVPVTFNLKNSKSFPLDLPPEADVEKKVIVFEHLAQVPKFGDDYTIVQSEDCQSLILTYKATFLQRYEWGEQDLSSTMTLYAKDGRKFKQTYTFKVKANTPPPKPTFAVAKTTGTPSYYVLCITAPETDMRKTVTGGLLHKDLAHIEINETPYAFSVNEAEKKFVKPESDSFITLSDVAKLTAPDADKVPTGGWVLYYKTDVEVKEGAAKKDYTIRLADEKGLVSAAVNASTKPNRPAPVQISLVKGICTADVNSDNTGAAPHIIGVDGGHKPATLRLTCATADSTIYYTLTEIGAGSLASPLTASGAGSGVDIPLPIQPGKTEAEYTLTVRAEAGGFETGAERTLYYKITAQNTDTALSALKLTEGSDEYSAALIAGSDSAYICKIPFAERERYLTLTATTANSRSTITAVTVNGTPPTGFAPANTVTLANAVTLPNSLPAPQVTVKITVTGEDPTVKKEYTLTVTYSAKVKSLSAVYDSGNQKIIVTWTNPTDSDFSGLTLSWKKGGGDATNVPLTKDKTGYEISGISADGSTYTITVSAKDDAGNESEPASVSVTASPGPSLTGIELSRAHLAYNDTDLTITATLKGSNFDLIASQSDRTVKVGIFKDNALVGSLQTATAAGSDYTVTLTAPSLSASNVTVEGAVYTVKVKLCGTYQSVTETFIISKEARLTARPELSVTQIASSEVTLSSKTQITIKGINLDIAGGITVQLYDSNGAAYGSAVPIDTSHTGRELTTLTADIPVPSNEGVFTAKVLFGGVIQSSYYTGSSYNYEQTVTHPAIQVYGSPKFTSFTIPNAGISKQDSTVTAVVKGAKFKAPGVSASDFSVSCATASITDSSAITIIDDATLKVSLTIPGTADNYTVTVTCGSASKEGTFSVKDYSEYTVGKIVLADKTLKSKDEYAGIDSSNPPVAIICGVNEYGAAIGIALHISPSDLRWAKSGSTGYNTKFEGIICTVQGGNASTATFIGDIDGSDNWDYICSIDPEGTKAAVVAENYPAFHWVNRYNEEYAGKLGGTNFAWYMPSLAELCGVYKNREAINASLAKIHGHGNSYADSSLGTSWFWSSSQAAYNDNNAWGVYFDYGNVSGLSKYDDCRVCCLAGL